MSVLQIFQTAKRVTTLGPYIRYGLWVQGCQKACPGCVSPESRPLSGGYGKDVAELAEEILSTAEIEGITISGGEPFLQARALCELLQRIKAERDLGVIVYTGYSFSEIRCNPLVELCDALIDGEYTEELDDGLSLRGSKNQKLIFVTDRYRDVLRIGEWGRRTELLPTQEGGTSMVGVPSRHSREFAVFLKEFWKGEKDGDCGGFAGT